MKSIFSSVSEKVTKNWKWLLLFLFLPGFNACEPSVGLIYPVSIMDVGVDPWQNQGTTGQLTWFSLSEIWLPLLISIIINFIIFLWLIKPLTHFFEKRKPTLWIGGTILAYHSALSFLLMWTKDANEWTAYSLESILEFLGRSIELFILFWFNILERGSIQYPLFLGIDWMFFQLLWLGIVILLSWAIGSIISLLFKK